MNYQIFQYLNSFAHYSTVLDMVIVFFADYLQYALLGILAVFFFKKSVDQFQNRVMVILALIAGVMARFGVKTLIVFFYPHPRPYAALPQVQALIPVTTADAYQSFPSGHTIFFFAVSTVIYKYNKKLGVLFFVASTTMGLSRIFVGVHWPADIFGGALLGILTGLIIDWLYQKYKNFTDNLFQMIFRKMHL